MKRSDDFYRSIAAAYAPYGEGGIARIAEQHGVPMTTAYRWVKVARSKGFITEGRRPIRDRRLARLADALEISTHALSAALDAEGIALKGGGKRKDVARRVEKIDALSHRHTVFEEGFHEGAARAHAEWKAP